MVISDIRRQVKKAGKAISTVHLYRLFNIYEIKPLAERQRPQQYPPVVVDIIKNHFGLAGNGVPPITSAETPRIARPAPRRSPARLISLNKIKTLKRKVKV